MSLTAHRLAMVAIAVAMLSALGGPAWAVGPAPAAAEPAAAAATPLRVPVAADTYVVQEAPDTSYGFATKLAASNWSTPWHSHIYLRFALPAPPAGQQVSAARLELTFQTLTKQPSTLNLHAVASTGWSEAITYSERPVVGELLTTAAIAGQGTVSLSFDVTAAVGSGGGARAFAILNPDPQSAGVFHSRERGAGAPTLVISYGGGGDGTLCGASFAREGGESWAQALARKDALFNGLEAVRFFHGGLPPAWPGPLEVGSRTLVVSFKGNARDYLSGANDAYMSEWFAGAPRDRDIYWVYYHEPEDNIRAGEFTAADYRAAWQRIARLADAAGNPRLFATQVLMEWTLNPDSGRNWRDYYPGDGVLDVLAWDVYNYDSVAADGRYLAPATLLDAAVAASASAGVRWGIAEMGSHIAPGDDGSRRAEWVRQMISYSQARGSLWNLWFDLDWSTGDYRLLDADGGAAVWREFCS